jgi:hypothetical protein
MSMTTIHIQDVLEGLQRDASMLCEVPLPLGAGVVDPQLIEPRDGQEEQQIEELIAFRCSCL